MKVTVRLLLCLLLSAVIVASIPCNATAEGNISNTNYQTDQIYQFLQQFVTENPQRSSANEEKLAADWIFQRFSQLEGVKVTEERFTVQAETTYISQNVIATVDNPNTSKNIIIGAHYDSISSSQGANDNATGVTALYHILQRVADYVNQGNTLPFDVIAIAFGAEEQGLLGSAEYANRHYGQLQNTLVMFNIDSIVNGDNLYVAVENKKTDLEQLVLDSTDEQLNLTHKPYAKGTYGGVDMFGYGYYETIQASDHTSFRLQGVPTVFYFSGTYSAKLWDFAESTDINKQTMNTPMDSLTNLDKYNGQLVVDRIQGVVDSIFTTVISDSFVEVASNARSQLVNLNFWYNAIWPRLAITVMIVLLALWAWSYYRKLQKKAIMGTAEIKNTTVFHQPDAEDIFTFKQ